MRRTESSCESDQDTCDRIAKMHLHTRWKKWPNSTVKQILPYKNCSDSMKCLALLNSKCVVQRKRNSQQICIEKYRFACHFQTRMFSLTVCMLHAGMLFGSRVLVQWECQSLSKTAFIRSTTEAVLFSCGRCLITTPTPALKTNSLPTQSEFPKSPETWFRRSVKHLFPPFLSSLNTTLTHVLTQIHRAVCHHESAVVDSVETSIALLPGNEELLQEQQNSTCVFSLVLSMSDRSPAIADVYCL